MQLKFETFACNRVYVLKLICIYFYSGHGPCSCYYSFTGGTPLFDKIW